MSSNSNRLKFKVRSTDLKKCLQFHDLPFSGAKAQCPINYEYIGGRCLLFLANVVQPAEDARDTCTDLGGKLARLDDCLVLGEVAHYLEENGKY